jgi:hypothetical protein
MIGDFIFILAYLARAAWAQLVINGARGAPHHHHSKESCSKANVERLRWRRVPCIKLSLTRRVQNLDALRIATLVPDFRGTSMTTRCDSFIACHARIVWQPFVACDCIRIDWTPAWHSLANLSFLSDPDISFVSVPILVTQVIDFHKVVFRRRSVEDSLAVRVDSEFVQATLAACVSRVTIGATL